MPTYLKYHDCFRATKVEERIADARACLTNVRLVQAGEQCRRSAEGAERSPVRGFRTLLDMARLGRQETREPRSGSSPCWRAAAIWSRPSGQSDGS